MESSVVLKDEYFKMLKIIKTIGALKKESGLFACCFKPALKLA